MNFFYNHHIVQLFMFIFAGKQFGYERLDVEGFI